jgi:hypothetical protein
LVTPLSAVCTLASCCKTSRHGRCSSSIFGDAASLTFDVIQSAEHFLAKFVRSKKAMQASARFPNPETDTCTPYPSIEAILWIPTWMGFDDAERQPAWPDHPIAAAREKER